jgi:hypothetical protein
MAVDGSKLRFLSSFPPQSLFPARASCGTKIRARAHRQTGRKTASMRSRGKAHGDASETPFVHSPDGAFVPRNIRGSLSCRLYDAYSLIKYAITSDSANLTDWAIARFVPEFARYRDQNDCEGWSRNTGHNVGFVNSLLERAWGEWKLPASSVSGRVRFSWSSVVPGTPYSNIDEVVPR